MWDVVLGCAIAESPGHWLAGSRRRGADAVNVERGTGVICSVSDQLQLLGRHVALVRLHRLQLYLDVEASVVAEAVTDWVELEGYVGQAEDAPQPVLSDLRAVVTDLRLEQSRHQHLHSFHSTTELYSYTEWGIKVAAMLINL